MIQAEAHYVYKCDTEAEIQWVLASLPPDVEPHVDHILNRVTYTAAQQVETPK